MSSRQKKTTGNGEEDAEDETFADEAAPTAILRPRQPGEELKVPETVIRRSYKQRILSNRRAEAVKNLKKKRKLNEHPRLIVSAQSLIKASRLKAEEKRRIDRIKKSTYPSAKHTNKFSSILCVRNSRPCKTVTIRSTLKKLGLRTFFSGVILANDKKTAELLRELKPFVFYGFPSLETVRNLFLKRAAFKGVSASDEDITISDNTLVEDRLGSYGIVCVEDIIHEVWNAGENFDVVMKSLSSFKLSDLKRVEGIDAKKNEFGNLGTSLDSKLKKIL